MNQCGREEPAVALSVEPAEPALALLDPHWRPPKSTVQRPSQVPAALDHVRVPPAPPPRLCS